MNSNLAYMIYLGIYTSIIKFYVGIDTNIRKFANPCNKQPYVNILTFNLDKAVYGRAEYFDI